MSIRFSPVTFRPFMAKVFIKVMTIRCCCFEKRPFCFHGEWLLFFSPPVLIYGRLFRLCLSVCLSLYQKSLYNLVQLVYSLVYTRFIYSDREKGQIIIHQNKKFITSEPFEVGSPNLVKVKIQSPKVRWAHKVKLLHF